MVPNHLFQLLSLVAMEPPARLNAQSVRSEKARALDAIRLMTPQKRSPIRCARNMSAA